MAENKALRGETMAERERFDSSPGSQENQGAQQNDVAQFVAQREALPLTPVWYQNLRGFIQGTFPADEVWKAIFLEQLATLGSPQVDSHALNALQLIHDTFVKDESQGYRSRDRQFAIEVASAALSSSQMLVARRLFVTDLARNIVRDFWVHDVNKPSWFREDQNQRLVDRIVRAFSGATRLEAVTIHKPASVGSSMLVPAEDLAAIAAEGPGPVIPVPGPNAALTNALRTAIGHIEHMAAWISKRNAGYSFESLGEDLPTIREALESRTPSGATIRSARGDAMEASLSTGEPPVGEASPNCRAVPSVKPLVWTEPSSRTNGCWTATCLLGTFSVAFDDGWHAELEDGLRWEWEPELDPRSYEGPLDAQRACLVFYETSIRSALGSTEVSP